MVWLSLRIGRLPGLAVIVVFLLILVWFAYESRARNWGPEVRAWLWGYPVFLMVGTSMMTGQLRYSSLPKIRTAIVTPACLADLALQWFWIDHALNMHSENITIWMP